MQVTLGIWLHIFRNDAAVLELNYFSLLYNISTTNSALQDVMKLEDLSKALEMCIHTPPEFFALNAYLRKTSAYLKPSDSRNHFLFSGKALIGVYGKPGMLERPEQPEQVEIRKLTRLCSLE